MDDDMRAIMNMTDEEVDAVLRGYGVDPDVIGARFAGMAKETLEAELEKIQQGVSLWCDKADESK